MNRIQGQALRAVVFGTAYDERGERPCLPWLARKGYITEAAWDAEVTYDGYVAGIECGALTPWFALSDELTLEVNTYGAGSHGASSAHLGRFLAALKRGLTDGSLRLVAADPAYYRVVAR